MKPTIVTQGKRKRAVARATIRKGTGKIFINYKGLSTITPALLQMKIKEPLMLAGEKAYADKDIFVRVHGGGVMGQADAARLAIAKALVKHNADASLEKTFLAYDRTLLVADVRRKET
ncbi:MAG: 30S ribosomal protein S9, partial [Candidatus Woesearchaeota archaeon]